jgi:hypothetical protein
MTTPARTRLIPLAILGVTLLVLLSACSDDSLAPFQPEITNQADSFQLQATGVRDVSLTRDYTWQNSGTTANVNQATTVMRGSANLVILDDAGTQVYARGLDENGSFVSQTGMPGTWTIRLQLARYDGTLNFRAQKP